MRRVKSLGLGMTLLAIVLAPGVPVGAQSNAAGFPDVPPWHWAYQGVLKDSQAGLLVGYPSAPAVPIENSVTQVYDGFAHAGATQAQAWVERFIFNRPAAWPRPLERAQLVSFVLRNVRSSVTGDAATATFVAETQTRTGRFATAPMRVTLRLIDGDWKIDYASLVAGSSLFR